MIKISETFQSMQGEGRSAGQLANFVRVAGCPLSCSWCDTPYTWDWQNHNPSEEIHSMSIDEVYATLNVKEFRLTVLTGGEPLLYQKELTELVNLTWEFNRAHVGYPAMNFEVETAGSLALDSSFFHLATEMPAFFRFNVSPKLSNSQNKKNWPVNQKFMEDMYVLGESSYLWPTMKFVVTRPGDFIEVGKFCHYYNIPRHAVYIMVEGTTRKSQLDSLDWVVSHCIQNGYNYSPRLHTLVWGNVRGV